MIEIESETLHQGSGKRLLLCHGKRTLGTKRRRRCVRSIRGDRRGAQVEPLRAPLASREDFLSLDPLLRGVRVVQRDDQGAAKLVSGAVEPG